MDGTGRALISELRERVGRIERSAAAYGVLPFGVAAIDRALPGGGLAQGAVHEMLGAGRDEAKPSPFPSANSRPLSTHCAANARLQSTNGMTIRNCSSCSL